MGICTQLSFNIGKDREKVKKLIRENHKRPFFGRIEYLARSKNIEDIDKRSKIMNDKDSNFHDHMVNSSLQSLKMIQSASCANWKKGFQQSTVMKASIDLRKESIDSRQVRTR